MKAICFYILLLFSFHALAKDPAFVWKESTQPYRNYIYPGMTGVSYELGYSYNIESWSLRRFLKKNYDIRASESIKRILHDVSTGVFFDRWLDVKVRYLLVSDTLFLKTRYENGDSVIEKYTGIKGNLRFSVPLTQYKQQHDFATGLTKAPSQKGLITSVDIFVKARPRNQPVKILTKLITQADMPGIVTKIKGRNLIK